MQGEAMVELHCPLMLQERVGEPVQPALHVPVALMPATVDGQSAWSSPVRAGQRSSAILSATPKKRHIDTYGYRVTSPSTPIRQ